ncbi:MAG TPA: NAD(P)-dependent oxidoreductase [Planctomycetota bacterium]
MIRWITERLGTAPYEEVRALPGLTVVDVRALLDREGNSAAAVVEKIEAAARALAAGEKTVVACEFGVSRSNAVAAGALARHAKLGFDAALARVLDATGEHQLRLEVVAAVRAALGEDAPPLAGPGAVIVTTPLAHSDPAFDAVLPRDRALVHAGRELLGDAVRLDLLARASGAEVLLHLNAPRPDTTNAALGAALAELKTVLDVCRARELFLVWCSSWEVYAGHAAGPLLAAESTPHVPRGTLGLTKSLGEAMIARYRERHGLRAAILRPGVVYGPPVGRPAFLAGWLEAARAGHELVAHAFRNGDARLDMLYIDDFRAALGTVVERRVAQDFNLGGGLAATPAVAAELVRLCGSRSPVRTVQMEGDSPQVTLDSRRAAEQLGWRPATPLAVGLAACVAAAEEPATDA